MSLDGRQTNNDGFTEAQAYANDPDNETAPSPMHHEKEVGVNAYTLATLADALVTIVNTPTADQKAALDAANAPGAGNAFTTVADLASFSSPTSTFYNFRTDTGVPASGEVKMDNAAAASATTLSFHNLNREGNNVGNLLLLLGAGDAIVVQDALDGDKSYNFDITGSATQTGGAGASGYITFPVSLFDEGSTALADNDAVVAAMFQDGAGTISNATIDSTNSIDGGALGTGTVARAALEVDAIDGTKLADNAVDSEHITADAIDGTKVADNAIDSEHYTDGSIDTVHLANDVIDGTKLADNAVNSEHYTDGSIDRVHLEADIIDSTKLADNSVNSEHYVDGSIDDVHLATGIDGAKLTAGSVPDSALASGGGGGSATTLYCSVAGSGDGSGSDASNRISAADMPAEIRGGQNFNLYMASGSYNATDTQGPFAKDSVDFGALRGKNINILIEGDVTVGSIESVNTNFSILSTGGTAYDFTVVETFNMYGGKLDTYTDGFFLNGETGTNDFVAILNFTGTAFFYSSVVIARDVDAVADINLDNSRMDVLTVDCVDLDVAYGSSVHGLNTCVMTGRTRVFNGSSATFGTLTTDTFAVFEASSVKGANIDVATDLGSTEVTFGSFVHASVAYGGADGTPSSDATSDVV